jgi:hypothetical protein
MTLRRRRHLRIVIATVGVFFAGAVLADRVLAQGAVWSGQCPTPSPTCVPLTLTANLQLTNLHSAVTHTAVSCTAKAPIYQFVSTSAPAAVVNRSFTGSVTVTILILASHLALPVNQTTTVTCELRLLNGTTSRLAVANAGPPVGMLDSNWEVVSGASTVKWTQSVTIPNANATP